MNVRLGTLSVRSTRLFSIGAARTMTDRGAYISTVGIFACALVMAAASLQNVGIRPMPMQVATTATAGISAMPYFGQTIGDRLPASWVRPLGSFLRRVLKRKSNDPRRTAGRSGEMGFAVSGVGGINF